MSSLLLRGRASADRTGGAPEPVTLPGRLGDVSDGLLQTLSLLFVPAAVGIIQHVGLVRTYAVPIVTAIIVSTLLTLVITALVFRTVQRRLAGRAVARAVR